MSENIEEQISNMSEEENLIMIYEFLTKYRVKMSSVVANIENGRIVFAHQKLQGLEKGLDHLRGKIALRLESFHGEDSENH